MTNFFITGTDTETGKTWFTIALMTALKKTGFDVMGMKPLATGATENEKKLVNGDASLIVDHSSKTVSYDLVNPIVCRLSVAPTIACEIERVKVDLNQIIKNYNILKSMSDVLVVEGIGGWRVPITQEYDLSELVKRLNLSVIMVVGLRLGCINHAILTADAIKSDGLNLCGWASNHLDRVYFHAEETIKILKKRLNCPHIADFGYCSNFDPDKLAKQIDPAFISEI